MTFSTKWKQPPSFEKRSVVDENHSLPKIPSKPLPAKRNDEIWGRECDVIWGGEWVQNESETAFEASSTKPKKKSRVDF